MAKVKFKMAGMPKMPMMPGNAAAPMMKYQSESAPLPPVAHSKKPKFKMVKKGRG